MLDLVIANGRMVTHERVHPADIGIRDGKYVGFYAPGEAPEARERIDAAGHLVFPGIIDCHAHLNEPGFEYREDFATGSCAAAIGGTTTLIDMPLNNEPPLVNQAAFDLKHGLIDAKAVVDYALWGGMVDYNLADLPDLHRAGVAAFKAFVCPMGTSTFTSVNMGQVRDALRVLKPLDALSGFHCEEYGLVLQAEARAQAEGRAGVRDFLDAHDVFNEYVATRNVIDLARETGARVYICHISHPSVAQLVKDAIHEGLPVTGETCPHYLGFTEDLVFERGAPAKCTPPLRTREARDALWSYVLDGTLSCVGSDHSPAADAEKDNATKNIWSAWGGLNAIQYFLPIMFDLVVHQKKLCPSWIARLMDYNPARVFRLYGRKGAFESGFDGDITIVDPDKRWKIVGAELATKGKVTAFEGLEGKGSAVKTIVRGRVVAEDGGCGEHYGYGEYLTPGR
ncbi:MAG: allantoinase AllB [Planctomycetes bacterium]|nr:allantoinase AllB [Planctomycetota bacterium]